MSKIEIFENPLTEINRLKKSHQKNILQMPARYNLVDCLKQLKYGRPISNQNQIDKWIKDLDRNPKNGKPFI